MGVLVVDPEERITVELRVPREPKLLTDVAGWLGCVTRPWPDSTLDPGAWLGGLDPKPFPFEVQALAGPLLLRANAPAEIPDAVVTDDGQRWPVACRSWLSEDVGYFWVQVEAGGPPAIEVEVTDLADGRRAFDVVLCKAWMRRPGLSSWLSLWLELRPGSSLDAERARRFLDGLAGVLAIHKRFGGALTPADRALAAWLGARLRTLPLQKPGQTSEAILDAMYASAEGETEMLSLRVGRIRR